MVKPALQKMERIRSEAGYNRGFMILAIMLVFASLCLFHVESSRAKSNELNATAAISHQVTVERIPSSEAQKMGVAPRNR